MARYRSVMVALGILLIVAGAIAIIAAATLSEGTANLLGADLSAFTIFLIGVAAGAAILWGWALLKFSTKRGLKRRRDRKEINRLQERLDEARADEHREDDGHTPA